MTGSSEHEERLLEFTNIGARLPIYLLFVCGGLAILEACLFLFGGFEVKRILQLVGWITLAALFFGFESEVLFDPNRELTRTLRAVFAVAEAAVVAITFFFIFLRILPLRTVELGVASAVFWSLTLAVLYAINKYINLSLWAALAAASAKHRRTEVEAVRAEVEAVSFLKTLRPETAEQDVELPWLYESYVASRQIVGSPAVSEARFWELFRTKRAESASASFDAFTRVWLGFGQRIPTHMTYNKWCHANGFWPLDAETYRKRVSAFEAEHAPRGLEWFLKTTCPKGMEIVPEYEEYREWCNAQLIILLDAARYAHLWAQTARRHAVAALNVYLDPASPDGYLKERSYEAYINWCGLRHYYVVSRRDFDRAVDMRRPKAVVAMGKCPGCDGRGKFPSECAMCNGTGSVVDRQIAGWQQQLDPSGNPYPVPGSRPAFSEQYRPCPACKGLLFRKCQSCNGLGQTPTGKQKRWKAGRKFALYDLNDVLEPTLEQLADGRRE